MDNQKCLINVIISLMKIYFTASMTGKNQYERNYQQIVEVLKNLGHKVIADHILNVDSDALNEESSDQRIEHNKQLNRWLTSSDFVVAEVSYPSVSVGYEIALALEKGTPVLALHEESRTPSALAGEHSDKFVMTSYNLDDLSRDLQFLVNDMLDRMDTRFNFFISPKHQNYLDWIAKNKKIPRAVFLRRLIEKDMAQNEDFQAS